MVVINMVAYLLINWYWVWSLFIGTEKCPFDDGPKSEDCKKAERNTNDAESLCHLYVMMTQFITVAQIYEWQSMILIICWQKYLNVTEALEKSFEKNDFVRMEKLNLFLILILYASIIA